MKMIVTVVVMTPEKRIVGSGSAEVRNEYAAHEAVYDAALTSAQEKAWEYVLRYYMCSGRAVDICEAMLSERESWRWIVENMKTSRGWSEVILSNPVDGEPA